MMLPHISLQLKSVINVVNIIIIGPVNVKMNGYAKTATEKIVNLKIQITPAETSNAANIVALAIQQNLANAHGMSKSAKLLILVMKITFPFQLLEAKLRQETSPTPP